MAGSLSDESMVSGSLEGISKGFASMLPPSFDKDTDDNDFEPSELYGKYTWMIHTFSQINKRELRSNAFEIGGYKWYILIYPKGCGESDHLSLFLCVANHDKLVRGWNHFAQFTIAVVNKDPNKSKYSDTLHHFWKKEHDWGWKKYVELSKLSAGFLDDDTLKIKAQVQVIRKRIDRPFPCLDYQYRCELLRVYLSNIETIHRRFVEEKRARFGNLIQDKVRWSSFCSFWSSLDQKSRDQMSREKSDSILPELVKHFFIEKEVTSTLVMEYLYIGLKALKEPSMCIFRIERGSFILVDDLLMLLEREATEPWTQKDGDSGEISIESDEKRLAEFGGRTIEVYVLVHIFSLILIVFSEGLVRSSLSMPHGIGVRSVFVPPSPDPTVRWDFTGKTEVVYQEAALKLHGELKKKSLKSETANLTHAICDKRDR